jgi:hypothetical protein
MPYRKKQWTLALLVLIAAGLLSPGAALAAKAKAPKVDLNTASQKELEDLPGVGAATASKIIAGRPYSKVSDLEKAGVAKSTIDKIQKLVTVSKVKAAPAPAPEKTDKKSSKSEKASSSKAPETKPTVGKAAAGPVAPSRPAAEASSSRAPAPASSAPAPSSSSPASAASSTSPSSTSAKAPEARAGTAVESPRQPPPAKGMVWVNTATKIYHYEGDRWYGATKEGKYMTEDEAIKAGYRASKEGQKKK